MRQRRPIAVMAIVLALTALGCISVEVLPTERTPTPEPSPTPARPTPLRPAPSATATTAPTPSAAPPAATPAISRVLFAEGVSGGSDPVGAATEFPAGTAKVYAFVTFWGMPGGWPCESVWRVDGKEVARTSLTWSFGQSGETWVDFILEDGGLPPGHYEWELLAEGRSMARGAFVIGGAAQASPSPQPTRTPAATPAPASPTPSQLTPTMGPTEFDPIIFAQGLNAETDPIMPSMSFAPGTKEVYAVWACRGMYQGLEMHNIWYHNGQQYASSNSYWDRTAERGRWWLHLYRASGQPLPSGDYRLELYVGGQLLQSGTFTIQ